MSDFSIFPPPGTEWLPLWRAAAFFVGTFILEDVAAVGAGLVLAAGGISWPAAFAACFLGIWMGDAGLYAVARCAGRTWFDRSSLHRFAARVAESERWFARQGTPILILSRLLPGARLPTYLAAGFLRVPVIPFMLITGGASCAWTLVILRLSEIFGARLISWLGTYKRYGLAALAAGVLTWGALAFLRRFALAGGRIRRAQTWFGRWRRWEFWPAWIFYAPVAFHCLWLALKYRGLLLPTAANPGMFSGGIVGESKSAILKDLVESSPEFTAQAELLAAGPLNLRLSTLNEICTRLKIDYPLILKPDVGQRGVGVKIVRSREQAERYLQQTSAPLVVQRYISAPCEVGIFYYRFPHETAGHIFAITEKVFPAVVGDGRRTLAELIEQDPRARFVAKTYLERFSNRRHEILPAGQELRLVESGNHAQGCVFRDGMRFCTAALERRIDQISQKVPGFFIGRYDIRFADEEELQAGRNFQIIELNGAAAEATSIYDARNSLLSAYETLFNQWELVFAIGAANRKRGCTSTPLPLLWQTWRSYSRIVCSFPGAD